MSSIICVGVLIVGRKAIGNGTFMMVTENLTCTVLLSKFLRLHASDYYPLPATTVVTWFCLHIGDTIQGKHANDVGYMQDCTVFLDYPVTLANV